MRRQAWIVGMAVLMVTAWAGAATAQDGAGQQGEVGWNPKQQLLFTSADERFSLRVGALVQVRFTEELPDEGSSEGSFRVRRAKVKILGKLYEHWSYKVQTVLNGGSVQLDDAYMEYTRAPLFRIRVGQGKTPFSRQFQTSGGSLQFVERSLASDRFAHGRDIGLWVLGNSRGKTFEYNLGVFNGNGVNQKRDDDGNLLYVARVVVTPFGAYKLEESAFDYPDRPKLAVGVSGLTTTQGEGAQARDLTRLGGELAFKVKGLNAVAEVWSEEVEPVAGPSLDTEGFYAQLGLLFPNRKLEITGRYSVVSPDLGPGVEADESETGAALSFYFSRHNYKLQADYRILEFEATPEKDRDEIRLQMQLMF